MNQAAKWLEADFRSKQDTWFDEYTDEGFWNGPYVVRPIFQLLSVMDAGTPMTIRHIDYLDPERVWF